MEKYSNTVIKLEKLKKGELTCRENVNYFLSNINKQNEKWNVYLSLNDESEKKAKELDNKRKEGKKLGKLFGLTFAIKSVISIKGMNINCSSKTLENYKGTFSADIVEKIEKEDGIILGIVNADEFACGSSGETSAYKNTINPKNEDRIPGGSSSGSAAAVAGDLCDIAIGTDTGGSIRNPASHCGICGVKPTYGLVSRYGLIDMSMSFDTIGPLAKDTVGCAIALEAIAGYSEKDGTSINIKIPDYSKTQPNKIKKIGIIKNFEELITDQRIKEKFYNRIEELKKLNYEIIELNIENINLAIQTYYPIVYTEVFSGTRKYDSIKYGEIIEETCGNEVLRRILGGKEISKSEYDGAYYKKALKVKEIINEEFKKAFEKVDCIITPVSPMLPHKFGTKLTPEEMYAYDAFTPPVNLVGNCAGVVCIDTIKEKEKEISIGYQIIANKFNEEKMFEGMLILESLQK